MCICFGVCIDLSKESESNTGMDKLKLPYLICLYSFALLHMIDELFKSALRRRNVLSYLTNRYRNVCQHYREFFCKHAPDV